MNTSRHSVGQEEIDLTLKIHRVTSLKDGIYLVEARATAEKVIPTGWTGVVAEYLHGKPVKWRHERDKSLGVWANAVYGEVHKARMVEEGVIDVEYHLFGSSTVHESLITEVAERQKSGSPLGMSITIEEHSRNGKLALVIPTELTVTPIPECKSCRTTKFSEDAEVPDDKIAEVMAMTVSLQAELTKKENELQDARDALVVTSSEMETIKAESAKVKEDFARVAKERDDLLARTDELKKKLAEYENAVEEAKKRPLIDAIFKMEGDDFMKPRYESWSIEELEKRKTHLEGKSVGNFRTSPAMTTKSSESSSDAYRQFLMEVSSPEVREQLKKKLESARVA